MSFPERVKRLVRTRSQGICEGCGQAEATEFHHRKYKSRQGPDTASNCLHLCGWGNHTGCHGKAHSADPPPGWAVHSWEDHKLTRARTVHGDVYLTDDGRAVTNDQEVPF